MSEPKHPMQPFVTDKGGVLRFKENAIVAYVISHGSIDLNKLATMPFSDEDRQQLAQLIGYSLPGYGELDYVSDEAYEAAHDAAEQERKAK